MGQRPPRPCQAPTPWGPCPNLGTPTTPARCPDHPPEAWPDPDGQRKGRYTPQARRNMRRHRHSHPLCAQCGQPGSETDHIIPLSLGGSINSSNLQTLCRKCHQRKTLLEAAEARHSAKHP